MEIIKLDTYQGNVSIKGRVDSLAYTDGTAQKNKDESFLGKFLFIFSHLLYYKKYTSSTYINIYNVNKKKNYLSSSFIILISNLVINLFHLKFLGKTSIKISRDFNSLS